MALTVPTPIAAQPPAPQATDDRVSFSTKSFAWVGSMEPTRVAFNLLGQQTYDNAVVAYSAAQSAVSAWDNVSAGVATIEDALAAIQSGPVVSVMGRSGIVTGLVETAVVQFGEVAMSTAPLGQWARFNSTTGYGSDWPTTLVNGWWNVFTYGLATRAVQFATQVFNGTQVGWTFMRTLHDSTWSAWTRIFTGTTLIEQAVVNTVTTGAVTCSPALGSLHFVILQSNTTITIPAPRAAGDQLTLRLYQSGSVRTIAFSSNVKLPVGASLPTMAVSQWLTITLIPNDTLTVWHAFIGGIHSNT